MAPPENANQRPELKVSRTLMSARNRRMVAISQIERATEFEHRVSPDASITSLEELHIRIEALEESFTCFKAEQSKIEDLDPDEIQQIERAKYEEMYYQTLSSLKTIYATLKYPNESSNDITHSTKYDPIRLPDIEMPIFSGDVTTWVSWYQTFCSIIDSNPNLSTLSKFHHLITKLSPAAKAPIAGLKIEAENYNDALKMLKERYENKKVIAQEHILRIFNQPKISKPSALEIRALMDNINNQLSCLRNLQRPVNHWDDLLITIVLLKLDSSTLSGWNDVAPVDRLPALSELFDFLKKKCLKIEGNVPILNNNLHDITSKVHSKSHNKSVLAITKDNFKCLFCSRDGHSIYKCFKFTNLSISNRKKRVQSLELCSNCLKGKHELSQCLSVTSCRICGQKHHSLLHDDRATTAAINFVNHTDVMLDQDNNTSNVSTVNMSSHVLQASEVYSNSKYTVLATAVVYVLNKYKVQVPCRILLDSGAQINLITERFVHSLGLSRESSSSCLSGIGNSKTLSRGKTSLIITSQFNDFSASIEANIIPDITGLLPHEKIDIGNWKIPKNIKLSDPLFNRPQKIDLLLGAELFFSILCVGQIKLSDTLPTIQNTLLGWVVSGTFRFDIGKSSPNSSHCVCTTCNSCSENLNATLKMFWDIENHESTSSSLLTKEEQLCEKHFTNNHSRIDSGRYQVKLPFKVETSLLGKSYETALRRFLSLERKLYKHPEIFNQYSSFINEYLRLQHMEAVVHLDQSKPHYFMPHHCVLKPSSSTTRLRVVFDASTKTSSGYSLNDLLMVGPVVQPDLFAIALKFRVHNFVFTADITKMYRQILIAPEDRNYQCILWRSEHNKRVMIYRLCTATYGTASASFLATRVLNQLAYDDGNHFPLAAKQITSAFYVDDILTGAQTLEEAKQLQTELVSLLAKGGFELRKWCANDPGLLENIPPEHQEKLYRIKDSDAIKTLGITWIPETDQFLYEVMPQTNNSVTKRIILSEISKLFDPLGLINPIIVLGKLFMQHLWQLKFEWDQSLPLELHNRWLRFRKELQHVNNVAIHRKAFFGDPTDYQLHAFSDSSERAYGACLYVRSVDEFGFIRVRLLCSKSKVAKRGLSLPRLELCAATLMVQLVQRVINSLGFNMSTFFWTDSTVVLNWLSEEPSAWQTFVANRVATIQEFSKRSMWFHIPTRLNPADIISRGEYPKALIDSELWFDGPRFLRSLTENWPTEIGATKQNESESERRKVKMVMSTFENDNFLANIKYHLNFDSLMRIVAYIIRFKNNCLARKLGVSKTCGILLTPNELVQSRNVIVRIIQRTSFQQELESLMKGKALSPRNHIRSLCPFIDSEGLIRVGGRLTNATLDFDAKHPILLPKRHFFTDLVLRHFHEKHFHAGPQALLSMVRQTFWIIHGRAIASRIFRTCVHCFKARPTACEQLMGDLPPLRVQQSRPFNTVGVDFCGPFLVHSRRRGTSPVKVYISLFICFTTKAVHMELVEDLTSAAFIAALRRFVGRRGLCSVIYSDNATNFIGAKNDLRELRYMFEKRESREHIIRELASDGITWKTIPARSPHFGGLWESAVKSAKYHLKRILNQTSLTFFELNTIIIQVEAILNSRPICPLQNNPNNFPALTPGHFIIGTPLVAIVGPNLRDVKNVSRLDRWQQLQWHIQHFWDRWSKEYLQSLQQRTKWTGPSNPFQIGDIALIHDENLPPMKWKLGRIINLHPGKDGVVRVVTLKTSNGTIQRAVCKIRRLPLDFEGTSSLQGREDV